MHMSPFFQDPVDVDHRSWDLWRRINSPSITKLSVSAAPSQLVCDRGRVTVENNSLSWSLEESIRVFTLPRTSVEVCDTHLQPLPVCDSFFWSLTVSAATSHLPVVPAAELGTTTAGTTEGTSCGTWYRMWYRLRNVVPSAVPQPVPFVVPAEVPQPVPAVVPAVVPHRL